MFYLYLTLKKAIGRGATIPILQIKKLRHKIRDLLTVTPASVWWCWDLNPGPWTSESVFTLIDGDLIGHCSIYLALLCYRRGTIKTHRGVDRRVSGERKHSRVTSRVFTSSREFGWGSAGPEVF